MKLHDQKIVQPEQMSVNELRQWLSQFGETNKAHFEKNRVQKGPNGKSNHSIRRRIQQLEVSLVSSSESTASTESLPVIGPPKDNSVTNGGHQCTTYPTKTNVASPGEALKAGRETFRNPCRPAPEPFFRQFDNEKPMAKDRMKVPGNPNNYRIVSIRKLLDSPPKATNRNTNGPTSWYEDTDADDLLDLWPGCTMLWQPSIYRPFVLEEERTVQSFDEALTDSPTTEEESEFVETVPCDASSFSDPGVSACASSEPFYKSHSGAVQPPKNRGFRSKLPLLLCKSVKESIGYEGDEVKTPPRLAHRVCPITTTAQSPTTFSPVAFDDAPVRYVEPRMVVREDSSSHRGLAGWSDDGHQSFDATMGEIFAEEMRRLDLDDKMVQEATSSKLAGTKESTTETLVTPSLTARQTTKTSSVTETVQQFGGSGKRNAVQRRREALERKWAEEKLPTHSKKIKWQVCNGTYKKKVTLSVQK